MKYYEGLNARIVIAHIILDMGYGGAEQLVVTLATCVNHQFYSSQVICLDAISGNCDRLHEYDIPVILMRRRQRKFDFGLVLHLFRYIRKNRIEILHAHDLSSLLYAVCAGRLAGIPVVMTEHSRHYLDARWLRRMEKRVLGYCVSRFIEVSSRLADNTKKKDGIPERKISVVVNGVDCEIFAAADGCSFRKGLGIASDRILIGMVGRLEKIKGPDILLQAFYEFCAAMRATAVHPLPTLVYVGQGAQRTELERERDLLGLTESVIFTGARSDIPSVMAGLDLLVLPSLSEGLPFALLEGMAGGCPVLASSVGEIPRIVQDGENGWLVEPGDAKGLTDKMVGILADRNMAKRIGKNGQDFVRSRYSEKVMIADYERIYLQSVSSAKEQ